MSLGRPLLTVAVIGMFSTARAANTIHVDDDNCPGPGSGAVGDPYCSIQTAIDNAVDTDEIVVGPGTYFETINFLGKAIKLRSSDGLEVTLIDAQGSGSVVTCGSGEGPDTVLEGFTITHGTSGFGGGMYVDDSDPTIIGCAFVDNVANFGAGIFNERGTISMTACTFASNVGSGLYNDRGAVMLTDCSFVGNTVGGMKSDGFGASAVATLVGCTFANNTAPIGGGIASSHADITLILCSFSGNVASIEGGGLRNFASNATVLHTTFTDNTAQVGGGMSNQGGSHATVSGCTFRSNSAVQTIGSSGGGMYNVASSPIVSDCTFDGNLAHKDGGGIYSDEDSNPTVINCLFTQNMAPFSKGGGLATAQNAIALVNCTLVGNSAQFGGGVFTSNGSIRNCIAWNNSPDQIFFFGDGPFVTFSYYYSAA